MTEYDEKLVRHYKEAKEQIAGWISELYRDKTNQDIKYAQHCEKMITIWKNTLDLIQREMKFYGFEIDE